MSQRSHEGPADGGLSSALLPIVQDGERLEHARSVLSGFCHRSRNVLNGIKMSLYLFRRESRSAVPDCWEEIESVYHQVEQLFDCLQTIYRPMAIAVVRSPIQDLIHHHLPKWRSWYEARGREIELEPAGRHAVGEFDPAQLGVGLDALASWRAEAAPVRGATRVGWGLEDGSIVLRWREIPGRPADDPIRPSGAKGCDAAGSPPRRVDALALPMLARIVAAHRGRLEIEHGAGFGVCLRWPQSQPVDADGVA